MPNKTSANIKNALFVGSTTELQKMLNRRKEDEIIEGESGQQQKKIILEISKIHYIKSMTPLPELLNGEELQNPIEVKKHTISLTTKKRCRWCAICRKTIFCLAWFVQN